MDHILTNYTLLFFTILIILIDIYLLFRGNKISIIKKDLSNTYFIFGLVLIIILGFITNHIIKDNPENERHKKLKSAYKKALLAFFIAYCAHIEAVLLPFFMVLILAYYFDDFL